jgi:hypothetical protein
MYKYKYFIVIRYARDGFIVTGAQASGVVVETHQFDRKAAVGDIKASPQSRLLSKFSFRKSGCVYQRYRQQFLVPFTSSSLQLRTQTEFGWSVLSWARFPARIKWRTYENYAP